MRVFTALMSLFLSSVAIAGDVEIEVHDKGKTPRVLYEYAPTPGARERVTLRVEQDQKTVMGAIEREMILPAMTGEAMISIDAAQTPGTISADVGLEAVGVESREGVPEGFTPMIEQSLTGFTPLSGRLETTPSGKVGAFEMDMPAGDAGALAASVSSLTDAFRNVVTALPEEPIGLDASWTVTREIPLQQYAVTQRATYTLWKIDGHRLALRVKIEQEVPPGVKVSDAGGDWDSTVSEFVSEGGGTVALSTKQLSPLLSDITLTTRVVIDSQRGNDRAQSAIAGATRVKAEGEIVK